MIKVIQESPTGRNKRFKDTVKNKTMSRAEFVSEIEKGNYKNYYIRKIYNIKTPVSKPDGKKENNLG